MAKKKSGAKTAEKLAAAGKSLIWCTPDAEQKTTIRMAAAAEGLPMSKFLLAAGLREAKRILEKMVK